MVLIMDTARFKYPPHWTPLELLVEAMRKIDADSGKPRGYMKLSRASGDGGPSSSILFVMTLRKGFDEGALRNIRRFFASVKNAKIENAAARETEEAGGMTREVAEKAHGNRAEEHRTSEHLQRLECKVCSNDGLEVSKYVSCFFSAAPKELLDAVGTVVHEFRIDPEDFGELHVRPQYQEIVSELLRDIRSLPVFPHVVKAAREQHHRIEAIVKEKNGLELLTVLLLASPVENLSACGSRVDHVMRESEEGASEIVRNEIRALRNQLWKVFRLRTDDPLPAPVSRDNKMKA